MRENQQPRANLPAETRNLAVFTAFLINQVAVEGKLNLLHDLLKAQESELESLVQAKLYELNGRSEIALTGDDLAFCWSKMPQGSTATRLIQLAINNLDALAKQGALSHALILLNLQTRKTLSVDVTAENNREPTAVVITPVYTGRTYSYYTPGYVHSNASFWDGYLIGSLSNSGCGYGGWGYGFHGGGFQQQFMDTTTTTTVLPGGGTQTTTTTSMGQQQGNGDYDNCCSQNCDCDNCCSEPCDAMGGCASAIVNCASSLFSGLGNCLGGAAECVTSIDCSACANCGGVVCECLGSVLSALD